MCLRNEKHWEALACVHQHPKICPCSVSWNHVSEKEGGSPESPAFLQEWEPGSVGQKAAAIPSAISALTSAGKHFNFQCSFAVWSLPLVRPQKVQSLKKSCFSFGSPFKSVVILLLHKKIKQPEEMKARTLKYMCHQLYFWTISICSLKQLRDLATAGVKFVGHQKFTLTYPYVGMIFLGEGDFVLFGNNPEIFIRGKLGSVLRNIKQLSFFSSNIIFSPVYIFVIIISLSTDSLLLLLVYDFRAIVLVLIRILHWSLLRPNKATLFTRSLTSRTSLFQWIVQCNFLETWCSVRTEVLKSLLISDVTYKCEYAEEM